MPGDGSRSGSRRLLLALLIAAACQGEPASEPVPGAAPPADTTQPTTPPDTAEPTTPPDTAEPGAPAEQDGWIRGRSEAPSRVTAGSPMPVLQAVRPGTHDAYQRVTLDFGPAGALAPGWRAEYIDRPLHQCGSGNQIFPVGDAWLEIRLEPAQAHTDEGAPTLPGREIEVGDGLLRRIYVTCDFEGVVTLVLAVEMPNDFRVFALADPLRVVVDVRR